MPQPIRVIVVDDDPWMRDALREVIAAQPDLDWVGEAVDATTGVVLCATAQPDVAITDLHMPGGGPAAVIALRAASPQTAVVICTADSGTRARAELAAAGATGHIVKGEPLRELLHVVRAASSPR